MNKRQGIVIVGACVLLTVIKLARPRFGILEGGDENLAQTNISFWLMAAVAAVAAVLYVIFSVKKS